MTKVTNFDSLLTEAQKIKNKSVTVVFPNNEETFSAIEQALKLRLAKFILVGDENIIRNIHSGKLAANPDVTILPEPDIMKALQKSIELVRDRKSDILMKGGIDTGTMMRAVLQENAGIRTGRLLSDIFILEFPQREENKFVMITDGGMTMAPDLRNKVELIVNAVEVAHALGNTMPKVAVLSATEMVVPTLQSTLDAAALSKMNERGQIKGCIVDGPFALDNAVSTEAAEEKRINSPVAGKAEILVAANIESANSLAKSTTYFAGLRLAHVIVGGKAPILIPSRADKSDAKMLSIALGVIMSEFGSDSHN
jgi:phosphate butyryltransferase